MSCTKLVAVVLAAVSLATTACGGSASREYPLQGQVLSVNADRTQANIEHDDIPGFMGAMTMSYKVRDSHQFEGLQPGDLITLTLVVVSSDAYLTDVRRVGAAPLAAESARATSASFEFDFLTPGQEVPLTPFVDQDGQTRDFTSFRGAMTIVTFIYTRGPMPTFCPLMDRHFATIQVQTESDPELKSLRLVSVSFDPLVDTPSVLKQHAEALGADPTRWTFLTGDRDEIDQFAKRFGVTIVRDSNELIDIAHSLRTAVIDAEGRLVKVYTGNEWTPDELLTYLRQSD